jgi:orotate phosphoribosyltransferase
MLDKSGVADALLNAGVVGFAFESPLTFKSGIVSPVYLDNRKLLMHSASWRIVVCALKDVVESLNLGQTVIAGIETAGIPHASALAYEMMLPTVFVRKQAKDHGLQRRIEGGDVAGRSVILIEDQISTGGSSLSGVEALREAGATVDHCLAVTSYGFPLAQAAFVNAHVQLHMLVTFADLLPPIRAGNLLTAEQLKSLEGWLADPYGWGESNQTP